MAAEQEGERGSGIGHMDMDDVGRCRSDRGQQAWADWHGSNRRKACDAGYAYACDERRLPVRTAVGNNNFYLRCLALANRQISQMRFHATAMGRIELANMEDVRREQFYTPMKEDHC